MESLSPSELPKYLFIMKATKAKFKGYDIKNIPSSTGRADVLSRFIMNALIEPNGINESIGIWLFFNDQFIQELMESIPEEQKKIREIEETENFSVLITSNCRFFQNFKNKTIEDKNVMFNERQITLALFNSFEHIKDKQYENSIFTRVLNTKISDINKYIGSSHSTYILLENQNRDLLDEQKNQEILSKGKLAFIIGDQIGFDEDLDKIKTIFTPITTGKTVHLASNIVVLIKYLLNYQ